MLTQNLFDELNSDKSPKSNGIHPVTFKNFKAMALECLSKMDSPSLEIIAMKGIFILFIDLFFLQDSLYLRAKHVKGLLDFQTCIFSIQRTVPGRRDACCPELQGANVAHV